MTPVASAGNIRIMNPGPSDEGRLYEVRLHKDARKGLERLPPSRRRAVEAFLSNELPLRPFERIPRKTKQLKGSYEGYFQWDVDGGYKVIYWVDRQERLVDVVYIGPHPKW